MRMTVRVADLLPGDYCRGSRTRILGHPRLQTDESSQRMEIKVQRSNGRVEYVAWQARTTIGIERIDT